MLDKTIEELKEMLERGKARLEKDNCEFIKGYIFGIEECIEEIERMKINQS